MNTRTLLYLAFTLFAALLVVSARFVTGDRVAAPVPAGLAAANPAAAASSSAPAGGDAAPPAARTEPGVMYRWRDAAGHIHYQTDPPPEAVDARAIHFVRTVRGDGEAARASDASDAGGAPETSGVLAWPNPLAIYTPTGMADLLDEVERTARTLEARDRQLDAMQELLRRP